jgi:Tol biopolymer transport system component
MRRKLFPLITLALAALACGQTPTAALPPQPTAIPQPTAVSRYSALPAAIKMTPVDDAWPPVVAPGWTQPVPLDRPVNTAGAEDSPFITPDGRTLYFVFTPDVRVPVDQQLFDGVTGIWVTHRAGDGWSEPKRVPLAGPGELHLDGCEFVLDDWMVFCSVREGNAREIDLYTATLRDGIWTDWQNWGEPFNAMYDIGEMHITANGRFLYFASQRPGGLGGYDLWVSEKAGDQWSEPINLGSQINTDGNENRPFVTADGQELWFDSTSKQGQPGPAVFRSLRQANSSWGEPEEIISSFAGEPTLTGNGRTLYFVHHYFSANLSHMLEADIYVSTRIGP